MAADYVAPELEKDAFNCPSCGAFAHQRWGQIIFVNTVYHDWQAALCGRCREPSIWREGALAWPTTSPTPRPNEDLPQNARVDYDEARAIVERSPRGAAALLRLAIQKLCIHLGQPGKNLNQDIGALVQAGTLSPMIQRALDVVRIVGNNAVHPGELDLTDDRETAGKLFTLVNLIADAAITQPKGVESLFGQLPEGAREAVARRDARPPQEG